MPFPQPCLEQIVKQLLPMFNQDAVTSFWVFSGNNETSRKTGVELLGE